jgi:DNA polymerase-3 subunit chi
MTEVQFHVNVDKLLFYTCRLLRKACRMGAKVAVTGEPEMLSELDRQLWIFEPHEFVPHVQVVDATVVSAAQRLAPVWLVSDAMMASHCPVLVNLGTQLPRGFESFERLLEVVSSQAAALDAARVRWKHYASRGYAVRKHEVQM